MKHKAVADKYGYTLECITKDIKDKRLYLHAYYSNSDNMSDAIITTRFANKGFIHNQTRKIEIENILKNKNIIEAYSYFLIERYSHLKYFTASLDEFLHDIPEQLILNHAAMKELLSSIPKYNSYLLVCVGQKINEIRREIEAKNKQKDVNLDVQVKQIKTEFDLQ